MPWMLPLSEAEAGESGPHRISPAAHHPAAMRSAQSPVASQAKLTTLTRLKWRATLLRAKWRTKPQHSQGSAGSLLHTLMEINGITLTLRPNRRVYQAISPAGDTVRAVALASPDGTADFGGWLLTVTPPGCSSWAADRVHRSTCGDYVIATAEAAHVLLRLFKAQDHSGTHGI